MARALFPPDRNDAGQSGDRRWYYGMGRGTGTDRSGGDGDGDRQSAKADSDRKRPGRMGGIETRDV